jgi:predicted metal-dependent hydrolase
MTNMSPDIKSAALERGVLVYGDEVIAYDIVRKAAKLNADNALVVEKSFSKSSGKIIIKVHPDQRVVATAPHHATAESIQNAMLKRARWIWQNIKQFASQHDDVLPREYVSGESQFYLGRRYVLKVLDKQSDVTSVKLRRGKLEVALRNQQASRSKQVKAMVDQWYLNRAKYVFHQRLQETLPTATWIKGIPSFRIMPMKKQWGSCSKNGRLILNPHLIKASKECIDYVILHELCHIAEHNHSEKFWRLLTQVMPNWREVKAQLDSMAEVYLNE